MQSCALTQACWHYTFTRQRWCAVACIWLSVSHARVRVRRVSWPAPPRHEITYLVSTAFERAAVVTGSETGQLCLWAASVNEELLVPRVMLLGHTTPILWIVCCLFERSDAIVSLCRDGLLSIWDPMDGERPQLPVPTLLEACAT